ncbi:MAG: SCP2 sterol-binding domain-containing protein [Magnetococcales bacterium]|nr:SCP2 sterol-binding domain-containing protein [Magnetococcales bacterium]
MNLSWLSLPLKVVPQPLTAVSLGVTLNLFFGRYPELRQRLTELSGKVFEFVVEDLGQTYYMRVADSGQVSIHTYSDDVPNVTMSGQGGAFLALLFGGADPDSLFFSRELALSGETDTGLRFKNILDNVEIDWERELGNLLGPQVARLLVKARERLREAGARGRQAVESELEVLLQENGLPRQGQLRETMAEVDALVKRVEQLEGRISRAGKRVNLSRHGLGPEGGGGPGRTERPAAPEGDG